MKTKKIFFALMFCCFLFCNSCKKDPAIIDIEIPEEEEENNNDTIFTHGNVPWPEWIFHHWVWEDESTQLSAMKLVADYKANGIPVGAIIIDSPWETGYNTFEWDNSLFPDPQAMIHHFHNDSVRVFIWITSMINVNVQPLYDSAAANNFFMKASSSSANPAVVEWWKGDGSLIDFFNPAAVNWWKSLMDKTLDMGIDGWKCDGTDYAVLGLNGPTAYSPGKGGTVSRIEYSHAYYRLFHEYSRQRLGNDRVITARPIDNYGIADIGGDFVAFAPKDINFCGWVGDQDATFDGLKNALNNMYHSSQYGYLAFGSDIGGYRDDDNYPNGRSKELFIRWAQLGAFSPIMENGGGGEHRPWMFDEQTKEIYRKLVIMRHCIVPYFMQESDKAYNAGVSLMQFVNKNDYSYLLGADIFVTPFLEAGTDITITFPNGARWVYLYDESKTYDGGQTVNLNIPYDQFPVFMKEGTPLADFVDFNSIQ